MLPVVRIVCISIVVVRAMRRVARTLTVKVGGTRTLTVEVGGSRTLPVEVGGTEVNTLLVLKKINTLGNQQLI